MSHTISAYPNTVRVHYFHNQVGWKTLLEEIGQFIERNGQSLLDAQIKFCTDEEWDFAAEVWLIE